MSHPRWTDDGDPANSAAAVQDAVEWLLWADSMLYARYGLPRASEERRRVRSAIANLRRLSQTEPPMAAAEREG